MASISFNLSQASFYYRPLLMLVIKLVLNDYLGVCHGRVKLLRKSKNLD